MTDEERAGYEFRIERLEFLLKSGRDISDQRLQALREYGRPWTQAVLIQIAKERQHQLDKWGEQPLPDVPGPGMWPLNLYLTEVGCKHSCQAAAAIGQCTNAHVLIEEVAEAIEAASDATHHALRKELIQVAAVCVKWIEELDRRDRDHKESTSYFDPSAGRTTTP